MSHVLVVHADAGYGKSLCRLLKRNEFEVSVAQSCNQAMECIASTRSRGVQIDAIIAEGGRRGGETKIGLFNGLASANIDIPVIEIAGCTERSLDDEGQQTGSRRILLNEPIEERILMEKVMSLVNPRSGQF
jgi:DNA-binding NtrC family response regulator